MAKKCSNPFSYSDFLIGEEIILRSLSQQEAFAGTGAYSASWSIDDRIEQSSMFFRSSILRQDFKMDGYDGCLANPPCPWDKEGDRLQYGQFRDIIMANDGIFTCRYQVFERADDPGKEGFRLGDRLLSYDLDQGCLMEPLRGQFNYYHCNTEKPGYSGDAVIKIEKLARGVTENTFYYLFRFVDEVISPSISGKNSAD